MAPKKKNQQEPVDSLTRIAIVSSDRCKPKKCRQECKKSCPVVKIGELAHLQLHAWAACCQQQRSCTQYPAGKLCVEVAPTSKVAWISEELCIGCGICVKVGWLSAL